MLADSSPEQTGSVSSSQASTAGSIERFHGGLSPARTFSRRFWLAVGRLVRGRHSVAVGGALLATLGRTDLPRTLIRAQISPGVELSEASPFALSPDGQHLVFAGKGRDGVTRLWLRRMGDEAPRPLPGTEAELGGLTPPMFWSPDGQAVAFDAAGQLKRFDLRDNATRTVCALPALAVGGSWNAEGVIIVGAPSSGLFRCSVADGIASELTRIDSDKGETTHLFPWFLPDGRHFLYVRVARNAPEGSGVYLGSLDDKPGSARPTRLLASGFGAAYIPRKGESTGHVVFLRTLRCSRKRSTSGRFSYAANRSRSRTRSVPISMVDSSRSHKMTLLPSGRPTRTLS